MYNYFMLIGKVEKIEKDADLNNYEKHYITLKVKRTYGADYDVFKLIYFGHLYYDNLLQKNIAVKGRLLQTSNLEIIAEKIMYFENGLGIRN